MHTILEMAAFYRVHQTMQMAIRRSMADALECRRKFDAEVAIGLNVFDQHYRCHLEAHVGDIAVTSALKHGDVDLS